MSLNSSGSNGSLQIGSVTLNSSSGNLVILGDSYQNGTAEIDSILSGSIRPTVTALYNIGTTSFRYITIFLQSSPNVLSDIRWKENVKVVENEYQDLILDAEIIEYNLSGSENKQIGINANKFHEQFKERAELITKLDEEGYYGADYVSFVPMLIKTVQSQDKKIKELEERLARLEDLL
jgi:hypothetical protein